MISVTPRRRVGLLVLLLTGVLVLLTGQLRAPDRRAVGWLGHAILAALAPLQVALDEAVETGERWVRALTEIRELRAENARLRMEVEQLRRRLADLEEARSEVARLRQLLALRAELPAATLAARVVARDPDTWFATVLINRGGRHGVRRHDVVVTAEGLVGRV
ncbi:MAG: rod shape-determining protein MreC, partial [Armatimonadota bacterium]|nr:rod shape-determining protein MreC [Armatimonadota bacterium]